MLSRNKPCFCGSGKRFKHCHGAYTINRPDAPIENWHVVPQYVRDAFNQGQMAKVRHYQQFGLHRPPLLAGSDRDRFIVRGDQILHWAGGGSFLNFLESDLLRDMGEGFRRNEAHPLHVWWKSMRAHAEAYSKSGAHGKILSTVAAINFFTVAHDLFIIADNARPRERLLKSLRVPDQFHGARHELMVAASLVRAGFKIDFSDETDSDRKHCDATAIHRRTARSYFVEMKAKGRPGILGKPGPSPSPDEMKRDVSRLLRVALEKPASGERLIFLDMNLPPMPSGTDEGVWWQSDAIASVRAVEKQPGNLKPDISAFIVFTNVPSYQMGMEDYYAGLEIAFTAFRKPGFATETTLLGDRYPDIADLFNALKAHDLVPDSF
ncbi:SEC-C domain-containing protein [Methylocystis sp. SB2]|uniref:SEC-C domain-containing protein n=1 Tax=Methylocystis sp. (strain SB2) TaxID=743836 RepID=UPI0004077087|nr:SEC-C domain-containing protein [Methylocystis sp. SB2]ULO22401.1 SEC-C domain-containing protein [Methylocystis sp. SB2]